MEQILSIRINVRPLLKKLAKMMMKYNKLYVHIKSY